MNAILVNCRGRTFKIQREKCGEAAGLVIYEQGVEPGITWTCVSGAHPTMRDAYADIANMTVA
jgi:hypothetical protein